MQKTIKTTQIKSYLTFNGNCREVMNFYKQCFGGKLFFQTIADSPMAEKMPLQMKEAILHASLTNGSLTIMGSDMVSENGLVQGNSVAMLIDCNTEAEAKSFYKKLAKGGTEKMPLQKTHWGALFGSLTDKFGNNWLINYSKI